MSYFDAIMKVNVKTSSDGQMLFFPYGNLGRGYVVPTDERFTQLQRENKWFLIGLIVLLSAAILLHNYSSLLCLVSLSIIFTYVIIEKILTRNLVRSDEKLTYREIISNRSQQLSPHQLWFFEILSIFYVIFAGISIVAIPKQFYMAVLLGVTGIICTVLYAWMIRMKHRQAQNKN